MPPLILCIDDNEEGLQLRKMVLEAAGYSVLVATGGEQGLEQFANHPIAAVVLDYVMPGMDGGEVAARMRELKPYIPIILLSGCVTEIPADALNVVDIFIPKGSPTVSLIEEVRARAPLSDSGERKRPQRQEMAARSESMMATSREYASRGRRFMQTAREHFESSSKKQKE